ncbi:15886_t:CDS:1, partial [Funneliformis geosporum]
MESANDSTNEGGSSSEPWKLSATIPQMMTKWTGVNEDLASQLKSSEKIMDNFLNNFDMFINFNTEENHIHKYLIIISL